MKPRGDGAGEIVNRLSVSSNGSKWVKHNYGPATDDMFIVLSVSSNGSKWVKPNTTVGGNMEIRTFSILERIEVGETSRKVIL